ncbi:MAG: hypothetical protein AVDCRST_MAG51-1934 [uncultured Ramlibacter sp.]|uniref:Uncharacterized protein n=1 Tax=uncultured Ramlibacter sp. TaxID=260755 RepID=A0A6J4PQW9_9BURK|nr:MAG: hypothetical protein AVDCRST_MAG51-1934 [uncultured Ramlibacter sp.]
MNARTALALAFACTALAACGGGGGGGNVAATANMGTTANGMPRSAMDSATGLVAYLQQLIGRTDETSEPVALGDATLPVDDAAEPAGI